MPPVAALLTMPTTTRPGPGSFLDRLPYGDIHGFFAILESALKIERHADLLRWLQGEVQSFLPHRILIAAWGDFALGLIYFDVVSPLPAARTAQLGEERTHLLLQGLFQRWLGNRRAPCAMPVEAELLGLPPDSAVAGPWSALAEANTLLVHGIKDQRGRHDCLYVLFGTDALAAPPAAEALALLLPYLDAAQRQVWHLPEQYPADPQAADAEPSDTVDFGLSPRELEIMEWVGKGKTNSEIGMILNISPFTVKNHLQRIFKKLDVMNRAQAVAQIMPTTDAGSR
jgi:transcriptional regulator EpsA